MFTVFKNSLKMSHSYLKVHFERTPFLRVDSSKMRLYFEFLPTVMFAVTPQCRRPTLSDEAITSALTKLQTPEFGRTLQ